MVLESVTHHVMGPYHIAHPQPNKPTRVMALGSSFRLPLKGFVPAISYMVHVIFTGLLMVFVFRSNVKTRRRSNPPLTLAKRFQTRRIWFLRWYSLCVENVKRDLLRYWLMTWFKVIGSASRIDDTWNNHDPSWCQYQSVENNEWP